MFALHFLLFALLRCMRTVSSASLIDNTDKRNVTLDFKSFSTLHLLHGSDFKKLSGDIGGALSFPFGVGLTLANIQIQNPGWNKTTTGTNTVMRFLDKNTVQDYSFLSQKLNDKNMKTKSVMFIQNKTLDHSNPELQLLDTHVQNVDFESDSEGSWMLVNTFVQENTEQAIHTFLPKDGWWGSPFHSYTTAGFINTNYFKSSWENTWEFVGYEEFWDGDVLQFYQQKGSFPVKVTKSYTAIAVPLLGKTKYVVFVSPERKMDQFMQNDVAEVLQYSDLSYWKQVETTVEIPNINMTSYNQHYKEMQLFGIEGTFCPFEVVLGEPLHPRGKLNDYDQFMSPIFQANYVKIAENYFEVASATASTVNSVTGVSNHVFSRFLRTLGSNDDTLINKNEKYSPPTFDNKRGGNILQFRQPFFWYLLDVELGPLCFGSVQSIGSFKREWNILQESSEFFNAALTKMWNCV